MIGSDDDYYTTLRVARDADGATIRAAYRALMRRFHPDVNASGDAIARAKAINEAYACLRDGSKRAHYDWQWNARLSKPAAAPGAFRHPAPRRPTWTGPTAGHQRSTSAILPTWGKAAGLGVAALITVITFSVTSATPPIEALPAKPEINLLMRADRCAANRGPSGSLRGRPRDSGTIQRELPNCPRSVR